MSSFLATFHTHLAALMTHRALTRVGLEARMAPVPRKISSSCGTCVFYTADAPRYELLDRDTEAVYRMDGDAPTLLREIS